MPTGRRGRLLAVGLVLITLGGLYFMAVAPLLDLYADRQQRLEDGRMLLPRLQATAAALPGLRARVAELRAAARTRKVTLDGASDAIAAANLQSRIDALATSVGATIGSTESLPAVSNDGYRRIGLRFALSGSYATLMKLLARLATAAPPLIVDNLQIHGLLRRPGLPADAETDPDLDAELDVYGFRNADGADTGSP
jgi:general secretion pathway protein M